MEVDTFGRICASENDNSLSLATSERAVIYSYQNFFL